MLTALLMAQKARSLEERSGESSGSCESSGSLPASRHIRERRNTHRRPKRHSEWALHWADGEPKGRGFPQPCLQPKYAAAIVAGTKTFEGRPDGGCLESVMRNDWINFQVNGGKRLIVRVLRVHRFVHSLLDCT